MKFINLASIDKKQCHIVISVLSFLILFPIILINFQLENPDDVLIENYGSWIDAFMTYTPRDGRHIISFLNAALFHLGFTFPMYQAFCSGTFILSFIYLLNSIISITKIDEKPFQSIFFTVTSILFPFMFDFYQWTSTYLIYSVGFAGCAAAISCFSRFEGLLKFLICGSLIAFAACAYQPVILLPFVILALCAFFKDVPINRSALSSQIILLISSLIFYFLYNEILKNLWELFAPKVVLQRTLSFHSIPYNFIQKSHTAFDIFFSHGAYHNLLYKPLSLLLFCSVIGLAVMALLKFDLKLLACACFLIIAIPTPILLLEADGSYWPSARISFYISMVFPLALLALLQKFPFQAAAKYGLCGILVLICGNAFSILHHRWLQDRLDEKAARHFVAQIEAHHDRPLTVIIDPARIQNWHFNTYELGGTIFWASYAIPFYMNELEKKHFEKDQVFFQRDDGKSCPADPNKASTHILCPTYN